MAQYLIQLNYTPECWAALLRDPQDRGKAVGTLQKLGGSMDLVWFSFGDHDIVGIATLPDNVAIAAFSMALSAGGACRNVKTTPLLSIAEGIEAMKKGAACGYRPVIAPAKA